MPELSSPTQIALAAAAAGWPVAAGLGFAIWSTLKRRAGAGEQADLRNRDRLNSVIAALDTRRS